MRGILGTWNLFSGDTVGEFEVGSLSDYLRWVLGFIHPASRWFATSQVVVWVHQQHSLTFLGGKP